jgi:DNA-binding transcriptional LysR family regulator
MLNLNDIALFVQVASAGSFAGAARRLGVPANTLSRRIQELESRLGVRLMQRSTRKLTLTDAGRRLYDRCSTQIEDLAQSVRDLSEDSAMPSGRVRIAAPADFLESFRMEWVTEFLALYPAVTLDFLLDDARIDLIDNGIDLAFRGGDLHEPNFVARRIGTARRVLAASPAYLAARGMPKTVRTLADHDCLVLTMPGSQPRWTLDGPNGTVEVEVDGRFTANTMRTILAAALAGLGIGLLSSVMMRPHLEAGRLQLILPEYCSHQTGIYFVYVSRRQQPKAARAFMEFAEAKMLEHWLSEPGADHAGR